MFDQGTGLKRSLTAIRWIQSRTVKPERRRRTPRIHVARYLLRTEQDVGGCGLRWSLLPPYPREQSRLHGSPISYSACHKMEVSSLHLLQCILLTSHSEDNAPGADRSRRLRFPEEPSVGFASANDDLRPFQALENGERHYCSAHGRFIING